MKTWQVEMLFVASCLLIVVFVGDNYENPAEWIGAAAVLLTFGHAQVADRLAEKAAQYEALGQESVACHRWAKRYWMAKEFLWLIYFVMLKAYSALVGVGVFLCYPLWRAWWRRDAN